MIKAIIFDCFGVLWVHKGPEYVKNHTKNYQKIRGQISEYNNKADLGLISQLQYEQKISKLSGLSLAQVHSHLLSGYHLNTQLLDFIEHKIRPFYKVALLSNITKNSMDNFFTYEQQQGLFDVSVLSCDIGLVKPDPEIYQFTCQKLNIKPGEAIMVDDIYNNCLGAEAIGMKSIYYEGLAHLRKALEKYIVT